ncbi:hypothetical protein MRS44_009539 [Fusarium solani]|uniref:uncharacterized protein n=1 Tax=Fusarium solani TaxID=169388 RepID=UPI0032C3F016|nr:hypothetical protein MRS44_009539 [Fusarium solani]
MLSALLLAALPALAYALDDGIIRYPIRASPGAPIVKGVTRRQNEVALQSQNTGLFYSIDVTMGTPGQTITVNLDTGSQELWVNPVCDKSNDVSFCESFGHFGESSTFTSINVTGGLVYGTGYAYYNYGYDFITIGSAHIKQQLFGVAYDTSVVSVGIMGVAPDLHGWNAPYPLVIDSMARQNLIKSRAFSLDIRTMDSDRGAVIFGGIDTRKYSGHLEKRPIIPASSSPDGQTRYWVHLDGMSLTQDDGSKDAIFSKTNGYAVVLDSGYTISALPGPIFEKLLATFPTVQPGIGSYHPVDCDVAKLKGTVDFTFGKTTIKVPYADFVWHNKGSCYLGAFQDDEFPVLGDTFLRAAYVVYDWDNENVWLANNEDCGTNLVAIGSGADSVPDIVGECASSDSTNTSELPTSTEASTGSTASTESVTSTESETSSGSITSDSTATATTESTLSFSTTRFHNSSSVIPNKLGSSKTQSLSDSLPTLSGSTYLDPSYLDPTYQGPTTAAPTTITSTITTSKVYTITSCPPSVTNCPVGSVTTEIITSYTTYCPGETKAPKPTNPPVISDTSVVTNTHVYTITDCPGEGPCNKGDVTTEFVATTQLVHPQVTAIYTVPEAIRCGPGNAHCKEATTKAVRVVTITPATKAPEPTPVPGVCTTCGPPGNANGTITEVYTHPSKPTQVYTQPGGTQIYTKPGQTQASGYGYPQPPASTVATVVKPSGEEPSEPTGTSPALVTGGAAWNAPGLLAVIAGALFAAML